MRKVLILLFFIFVQYLSACEFSKDSRFRFGAAVRFHEKDADHFCNGQIRNPLAFGYYQVDKIACHYKTMGEPGSNTIWSAGWDLRPSEIVSEKEMVWLFEQHLDVPTGYQSYSPIEGMDKEKTYYPDKEGNWRINETGEIAPKAKPDQAKLDKLLYDTESCKGWVDGFLWAKSAYSKIDAARVPFIKDCLRVHPNMKNRKLNRETDKFLTAFWGGKENFRKEITKALQKP